jgi:hypothetical protein
VLGCVDAGLCGRRVVRVSGRAGVGVVRGVGSCGGNRAGGGPSCRLRAGCRAAWGCRVVWGRRYWPVGAEVPFVWAATRGDPREVPGVRGGEPCGGAVWAAGRAATGAGCLGLRRGAGLRDVESCGGVGPRGASSRAGYRVGVRRGRLGRRSRRPPYGPGPCGGASGGCGVPGGAGCRPGAVRRCRLADRWRQSAWVPGGGVPGRPEVSSRAGSRTVRGCGGACWGASRADPQGCRAVRWCGAVRRCRLADRSCRPAGMQSGGGGGPGRAD